jgi:hypothetical protein
MLLARHTRVTSSCRCGCSRDGPGMAGAAAPRCRPATQIRPAALTPGRALPGGIPPRLVPPGSTVLSLSRVTSLGPGPRGLIRSTWNQTRGVALPAPGAQRLLRVAIPNRAGARSVPAAAVAQGSRHPESYPGATTRGPSFRGGPAARLDHPRQLLGLGQPIWWSLATIRACCGLSARAGSGLVVPRGTLGYPPARVPVGRSALRGVPCCTVGLPSWV